MDEHTDPSVIYGSNIENALRILGKFESFEEANRLRGLIVALWRGGADLIEENARLKRELQLARR